jgi:hypothetical protein
MALQAVARARAAMQDTLVLAARQRMRVLQLQ